ncbi:MAG TPA: twin-arginine translocase TatA/TatE family subunit [bacterium]|nr:twin-arginine translocase TatA/TatE family subunit [bacterium]
MVKILESFGVNELLVVCLTALLIFGAKRITKWGSNFKKWVRS